MEQAHNIASIKEITIPELLNAIAEAHAGQAVAIYEHLDPALIDKTTEQYWNLLKLLSRCGSIK